MTITVTERGISRSVKKGQTVGVKTTWMIDGTESESEAIDALFEEIPSSWEGYPLLDYGVDREEAIGFWDGHADYGFASKSSSLEVGQTRRTFSISSETEHVMSAISKPTAYPAPGVADIPDFGFGVNPVLNGKTYEIQGTDIPRKAVAFQIEKIIPIEEATDDYYRMLTDLAFTVNANIFKGYPRGEVLLQGISDAPRGEDEVSLTFSFARSQNRTVAGRNSIKVGDIENINKLGWQRLSILCKPTESGKLFIQKPICVFVEDHFEFGDFTKLGV